MAVSFCESPETINSVSVLASASGVAPVAVLKHDLAPLDIVGEDIAGRCGKKQNLFWAAHGRQGKLEGKDASPVGCRRFAHR